MCLGSGQLCCPVGAQQHPKVQAPCPSSLLLGFFFGGFPFPCLRWSLKPQSRGNACPAAVGHQQCLMASLRASLVPASHRTRFILSSPHLVSPLTALLSLLLSARQGTGWLLPLWDPALSHKDSTVPSIPLLCVPTKLGTAERRACCKVSHLIPCQL